MSNFTDPVHLEPLYDKGLYRLVKEISYDIGFKGSGLTVKVPAGYETNLASIPRLFWSLAPPYSPHYAAAAVLHDWLYDWKSGGGGSGEADLKGSDGGKKNGGVSDLAACLKIESEACIPFTRVVADGIFYEALRVLGVPRWKAIIFYGAVRLCNHWR